MVDFKPVRLAYDLHKPASESDKDLAPVIFLHGCTDYKGAWGDIPRIVSNESGRKVYTLDARNHGDSEWSDVFHFEDNVDDLIHFMDNKGIRKAILVGHSMGGRTAMLTALRAPHKVEKIVVEDMVIRKVPDNTVDTFILYIKLLKEAIERVPTDLDEEKAKIFIMKHIQMNTPSEIKSLTLSENDSDSVADACFLSLRRDVHGRYRYKCNLDAIERGMLRRDNMPSEPEGVFEGPTCFIYGQLSPMLVGSDEYYTKKYFPNSVYHGMEEVGHNIHNVKPLEFTEIMLKFIS